MNEKKKTRKNKSKSIKLKDQEVNRYFVVLVIFFPHIAAGHDIIFILLDGIN
jgi:hypothetical protein